MSDEETETSFTLSHEIVFKTMLQYHSESCINLLEIDPHSLLLDSDPPFNINITIDNGQPYGLLSLRHAEMFFYMKG